MKKAGKARALIITSLQMSQVEHIRKLESPQEIWEKLKEVHEPQNRQHPLFLRRKFFTLKMQEGDSIQDYINKIKLYYDKLEVISGNLQEEDVLAVLLASLPESYKTLILTLEAQPEIIVKHIISHLLQEETRRKQGLPGSSKNEGEAYFIQKQNSNNKKNPKGKGNSNIDKSKDTCHACRKIGHWANECRSKKGKPKKNNQDSQANEAEVLEAFYISEDTTKSFTIWYIDSRISEHLSPDRKLFHDLEEIYGRKIRVGNDDIVTVQYKGRVTINIGSTQKTLSNILYTLRITKNLLAVSELTATGFHLYFTDNYCDILDRNNTFIIKVLKNNNVYPLPQEDTSNFTEEKNISLMIWHKKLGYLGY